jgi:hypothetical protein
MQERQTPIEGNRESQATPPTRTGDNVPTSDVTPREARTMATAPIGFIALAIIVAIIVAVVLLALR